MDYVYMAFANSATDGLATLSEEDHAVHAILLDRKERSGDLDFIRLSNATTEDLLVYLGAIQEKMSVFLYSGHAGRDKLMLLDQEANADGIAEALQLCQNLKLVILNGCSTKGQVEKLLDCGIPVVIATSCPVEDQSATRFSIAFFQSFVKRMNTIEKAFADGLAAAKTVSKSKIDSSRGILLKGQRSDEPVWGLYFKADNKYYVEEWQLGLVREEEEDAGFEPNKLLKEAIWEGVEKFLGQSSTNRNINSSDKSDMIITELPDPISEDLRRLIARGRSGEEQEFYNELGSSRLKHLVYTYTNIIELMAYTLLAQLWDELKLGNLKELHAKLRQQLEALFNCTFQERKTYSLLPLIREIHCCFDQQDQLQYFIQEYGDLKKEFEEESEFCRACTFIEQVRSDINNNPNVEEHKARKLCIDLEKKLALILKEMGFMVRYKMASMKSIDFIRYKHSQVPNFRHHFIELRYRPSGMDIESQTLERSMDNASVVIIRQQLSEPGGQDAQTYLNLSPFVIDINTFDDTAKLADLYTFSSFEKGLNTCLYRQVHRQGKLMPLKQIMKEDQHIINEQVEAFYQLVLKESISL